MPKLIDYPRTNYDGAWELCEVVDDTGGKCSVETAAKKLDRKVSGSFKAIIGSAVKFGLLTSKRELLSTTTLFKRIKHAYDKQEEIIFHREAFLAPPLFTQICRKFRLRELPVQMLDVMLIREFGVEEINAQGVAKAFVDGCRMVGILDEHNIMADIDMLSTKRQPKQELANPEPIQNSFEKQLNPNKEAQTLEHEVPPPEKSTARNILALTHSDNIKNPLSELTIPPNLETNLFDPPSNSLDAIANLFGLATTHAMPEQGQKSESEQNISERNDDANEHTVKNTITAQPLAIQTQETLPTINSISYEIQISGPGISTILSLTEEEDITLAVAILEKIRRQLRI